MSYIVAAWMMLAGVADIITTERALARGARELNPIMRALQKSSGRGWRVGKILIHAVIAGVVLFIDNTLGIAVGATVAGIITAVAVQNWRTAPNG
jgi:Flp pilus assembly protein TadB